MGFLSGLFEQKATQNPRPDEAVARATGSSTAGYYTGIGLGPAGQWDLDKAVRDGVERVTWVFRAVDAISQKQSTLPIILRKGYDREEGEVVEDDRLFRLLNFRANTYESSQQFRYRLSAILLLSRRGAFIEVVNGRDGRPSQLHLLPPGVTRPIPHPDTFVSGYEISRGDGGIEVLPPDRVIWLKIKPHPTDPYSQMTPLMSAGISVDTDFFAHLFNRNFLANDGRPGMLITVKGNLHPEDAKEIKNRFAGGAARAGQTTVIEADDIQVADTSASPRDVQWSELLRTTKDEILLAFGVPESIMGNASGRTFDNADAEREMFYVDTMVPHCDSIASGLDPLTGDLTDDVVLAYDYSEVEVLQRAARRKREEWRVEVNMGLKTINDYFELTGKEPWDVLPANLLWHPSGIAIAPTNEQQAEIAQLRRVGEADPMAGMGGPGGMPGEEDPMGVPLADQGAPEIEGRDAPLQITDGQDDVPEVMLRAEELARKMLEDAAPTRLSRGKTPRTQHKSLIGDDDDEEADPDRYHVEGLIEGIVTTWDARQADVIPERLNHVKSRKGTRHWDGEQAGETKAIDPAYAVQTDQWVGQMESAIRNVLFRTIRREANKAARQVIEAGLLERVEREYLRPVGGRGIERLFGGKEHLNVALNEVYANNITIMRNATRNQMQRVERRIRELDAEGRTMRQIEMEVRKMLGERAPWRRRLAVNVTTAAIEGARHAVLERVGRFIVKEWHAHDDERTRATHRIADGQQVRGSSSFRVGGAFLRFPADPLGPIHEVIQCRCWTSFSVIPAEPTLTEVLERTFSR